MKTHLHLRLKKSSQHGFSLIVTLTMLVLLTVVAVGLLGLSTVTLRTSAQSDAKSIARANARLALMLAIGQLQTTLGSDQAASARASAIQTNPAEPNIVGAWSSWRWAPIPNSRPSYTEKKAKFRGWLVSNPDVASLIQPDFTKSQFQDFAWLINPDRFNTSDPKVKASLSLRAPKVKIGDTNNVRGSFAWAVIDESQKAPVHLANSQPRNSGQQLAWRNAPPRTQPETLVSQLAPTKIGDPTRLITLPTASAILGRESGNEVLIHQAHLTTQSLGLLTDSSRGGLKSDLSTLLEQLTNSSLRINGSRIPYNDSDNTRFSDSATNGEPTWAYIQSLYQSYKSLSNIGTATPGKILQTNADRKPTASTPFIKSPTSQRLLPVISKLQVIFSLVTHNSQPVTFPRRKYFYDKYGQPQGAEKHFVPHLVYEPVITLYNPYDVTLEFRNLRVKMYDPPVVFGFKKNADWFRPQCQEDGTGFDPIGRFTINTEKTTNASRSFSLILGGGNSESLGTTNIVLRPGELKVFSARVQKAWTWAAEDVGGGSTFFDYAATTKDFGNRDGRTANAKGVEAVAGWDPRAGLQTDHLSYAAGRPANTVYSFEQTNTDPAAEPSRGGWVSIRTGDTVTAYAKPGKTSSGTYDFQVDLMAGLNDDPGSDLLRTYRFTLGDAVKEISARPSNPVISRKFTVDALAQAASDQSVGGKLPFSVFTMALKTTSHTLDFSKPWQTGNPAVEGIDTRSSVVGNALDTYDLRFEEVEDYTSYPVMPEIDAQQRGFYGASTQQDSGATNVPMFRIPVQPMTSLGELIHTNLVAGANPPRFTYPFGNSYAHPLIPANSISKTSSGPLGGLMLDQTYLLNDALWDRYYFSTAVNLPAGLLSSANRRDQLARFFNRTDRLLNPRLTPIASGNGDTIADNLNQLAAADFSRMISAYVGVNGPFNLNSDSVEAWEAVLSSMKDSPVLGWLNTQFPSTGRVEFPRSSLPVAGDADATNSAGGITVTGTALRWAGFRGLDDGQVKELSQRIVEEIRKRGQQDEAPILSVAEFVNRRPGSTVHQNKGLLATAIDNVTSINRSRNASDWKILGATTALTPEHIVGASNPAAREGYTTEGSPVNLTQGDLMTQLAPIVTVRGDTFVVRAYGECLNKSGKVEAREWCEAVVQRIPEFVDPTNAVDTLTRDLNPINTAFGRRFVITSMRWLSPEEI